MAPFDATAAALVAAGAAAIFYGPWQWVCTDWIRQECFEARDRLFDLAADGKIDFSSSEYRTLREMIEAEIRFAHDMTLPYLFVVGSYLRYVHPEVVERVNESDRAIAAKLVDHKAKDEIHRVMSVMNRNVLKLLLLKSPLLVVVPIVVLAPLYLCLKVVKSYLRMTAHFANTIIRLGAANGRLGGFDDMSPLPPV